MKTLTSSFLGLLLILAAQLSWAQAVHRVNNTGVTGPGIFLTAQAAHDAAAAGDVIYLEPTAQTYGNLVCTKRLTIIGNGYFLGENTGLQLDARASLLGQVDFATGSAGSRLTGCSLSAALNIGTDNIIVERNRIASRVHIGQNPFTGAASGAITQGLIRQNYLESDIYFNTNTASTVNNIIITNNVIRAGLSGGTATSPMSALVKNNVFGGAVPSGFFTLAVANCLFSNNIMTGSSAITGGNNNTFNNNISDNAAFGTADGNQANVPASAIFVGAASASADGAYQLKSGTNPARGTGEGGADCGVFGGSTPYRLSGIPAVPTVFQYSQTVTGTNLNVTISTKSND